MKSSFDILDALFELVKVPAVTDEISGNVYANSFPEGNQDENITLNIINNPNNYLQVGYANLNIYVKEISAGRANLSRLRTILDIVSPLVENVTHGNFSFQIDDDKGVFKDQDTDSMYFYNLKLKFQAI